MDKNNEEKEDLKKQIRGGYEIYDLGNDINKKKKWKNIKSQINFYLCACRILI